MKEDPEGRNEFEQAVQADMMVNTMIHIANCLTRVFIAMCTCAGLLGFIAFMLVLRTMLGR